MAVTGNRTPPFRRSSIVLVVLALLAAACTDDDDTTDQVIPTTIPPAQTLMRVGVEQWPACLNPITCDSPELREQILQHVLPVVFEVDGAGEYQPSPLLAGRPEVETTDTGMTITYRLDSAARWYEGQPITSSDVRGTWQAIMATPGADTRGYELITGVDDRDPLVAVVHLSAPYGDWKELFGGGRGWVLEADAFGPSPDLTGQFQDELPFSAAPYRLAAWDEDAAVLTGAPEYWARSRTPDVDQVRLTRVNVAELVEPASFDLLVPANPAPGPGPDGFATRTLPTTKVLGVWFDQRTPLLASLPHRQALAALIDRGALVSELTDDTAEPFDCLGWLPGAGPWCAVAEAELPQPDDALAGFVLALEGWVASETGDLSRGFEIFTVLVTFDPAVPGAAAVANEVVAAFGSIGIATDRSAVANRTWAGPRPVEQQTGVGVYELELGISPQVDHLYACPEGTPTSVLAWCPAEIVEPARELGSTTGLRQQADLIEEIGSVAAANVAWMPIVRQSTTSYVQSSKVELPGLTSATGGPLGNLHAFRMLE